MTGLFNKQTIRFSCSVCVLAYSHSLPPFPPVTWFSCWRFEEHRSSHAFLFRKEVIQPQLPLRLPCYDFVPVAGPTLGICVPKVRAMTLGVTDSHDVTGGVYKARERIHRGVADPRLLATPTSCRRFAACNPNFDWLSEIRSTSRLRCPVYQPL